ncbi:hypothetical protein Dimus_007817, partial [Dionaea muscipula]
GGRTGWMPAPAPSLGEPRAVRSGRSCRAAMPEGRQAPSRVVMSSASTTCEDPRARAPLRAAASS